MTRDQHTYFRSLLLLWIVCLLCPAYLSGTPPSFQWPAGADTLDREHIYRSVFESAYGDGNIAESERRLLESLQSSLRLTSEEARSLEELVRANSPERIDQSGRWPLVLQNIAWGGGLYGWGIPYVLDAEDPKWYIGTEMISLGTAFYLTYRYTRKMNISHSRAQMMRAGSVLGFRYGWNMNTLADLWPDGGIFNGDQSKSWSLSLMGAVPAGIYLGDYLYQKWEPTHGQSWALTLWGELGGYIGRSVHELVDERPTEPERWEYESSSGRDISFDEEGYERAQQSYDRWRKRHALIEMAAYPAALYLGHRYFGEESYTFGDALMLHQGRWFGWMYGAMMSELVNVDPDTRGGLAFRLAGSVGGPLFMDWFIGGKEYTFGESFLMLLGTGSGMAFGVGTGALLEISEPEAMSLLFMSGGAAGFLLTNSILDVLPERDDSGAFYRDIRFTPGITMVSGDGSSEKDSFTPVFHVQMDF